MPPICSTEPVSLYTMMARATVDMEVPTLESPWASEYAPDHAKAHDPPQEQTAGSTGPGLRAPPQHQLRVRGETANPGSSSTGSAGSSRKKRSLENSRSKSASSPRW